MSSTARPTCEECPKFIRFREEKAKRQHGITMRPGERYCTAFPRARRFRTGDPKVYVPKWCPRRISPLILRIYEENWYLSLCLKFVKRKVRGGRIANPSGYTLRYEGTTHWTGSDVKKMLQVRKDENRFFGIPDIEEYLKTEVHESEILEFDDGLKPMFYLIRNSDIRQVVFDKQYAYVREEENQ